MANDNLSRLKAAAAKWRECMRDVGAILIEIEKGGIGEFEMALDVLHNDFGMSRASAMVARRWACGDFGDEALSRVVVTKLKHSVAAEITQAALKEAVGKKHAIYSPDEKRVVKKTLLEMSRNEARANVTSKGVRPLDDSLERLPPIRACKADHFEIDENGTIRFVGRGAETAIHMRVSRRMLREALEQMEAEKV